MGIKCKKCKVVSSNPLCKQDYKIWNFYKTKKKYVSSTQEGKNQKVQPRFDSVSLLVLQKGLSSWLGMSFNIMTWEKKKERKKERKKEIVVSF